MQLEISGDTVFGLCNTMGSVVFKGIKQIMLGGSL